MTNIMPAGKRIFFNEDPPVAGMVIGMVDDGKSYGLVLYPASGAPQVVKIPIDEWNAALAEGLVRVQGDPVISPPPAQPPKPSATIKPPVKPPWAK